MMRSRRNRRGVPPAREEEGEEAAGLWAQNDKAAADEEKLQSRLEDNREPRAATIEEDQRAARDRNFSSAWVRCMRRGLRSNRWLVHGKQEARICRAAGRFGLESCLDK